MEQTPASDHIYKHTHGGGGRGENERATVGVPVAVMKHNDQNQLSEGRVYFTHTSILQLTTKRSRAGPQIGQAIGGRC